MKVTVNRPGIRALERDPGLTLELMRIAKAAVIKYAIPNAPKRTLHYVQGISVGIYGTDVLITSADFKTWWLEKGTKASPRRPWSTPAFHTLENTARFAGWTYIET